MANRREFLKASALGAVSLGTGVNTFHIGKTKRHLSDELLGHGDFQYRLDRAWGDLDPARTPVNNCHEMVMDRRDRLFMLTDHPKNNIIVYDTGGKLLFTWTLGFSGAHGLTLVDEGDAEYLYVTDSGLGKVVKCTLDGNVVMELPTPLQVGTYTETMPYRPTETAVAPNGDIYVADGYGAQFILQFDAKGQFIRKFGGDSFLQPDKFKQVHGVAMDLRDPKNPTLLCSARIKNTFKRFTLDGQHLEDIYLPGAFISRPVLDGDNLYSGVCFGMSEGNYNMQLNKGFITILDKNNLVVSNPGGTAPRYENGKLTLMLQEAPVFKHCHDVCVDRDKNLYACQWNAGGIYPYKLHRV
ncbi:MAG: twin-arginine translocation signal domain-containing protein [Lunatimonas sp.]|uniref:twin-arginine translocation signal domain-containing protein n=1 Tax=Lunatimonas sp. TaxID=2060141 RepID=UPI00263B54ED|nr:twin-arginine translocation signal domain-containing protein [Lunatimonas sp.]MCC5935757.1 twin-arginine translocation signal domain-containing protein [Lunatimonas sp.]